MRIDDRGSYALTFAALSWLVVAAYLGQAILAGQFLSGTYPALRMHQLGATGSDVVLFVAVISGALLRWRAKGPAWPFWAALGLLAANQVQNGAGAARLISLHIPLGAAMLATAVTVAVGASLVVRRTRERTTAGTHTNTARTEAT